MKQNDDSLRGLFYITRGQYSKKLPSVNLDGDTKYIGGYDPTNDENAEWYQVRDNITHYCIFSGSDLNKALKSIQKTIVRYKTRREYFRQLSKISSEDYYEVTYLGRPPLTPEQRAKKVVGRCPRVSNVQKKLDHEVFLAYGDYYKDSIEEIEDIAYERIDNSDPFKRSRKLCKSLKTSSATKTPVKKLTPKEEPKKAVKMSRIIKPRKLIR